MMRLLEDHERGPMRVRVAACDCDASAPADCASRFMFAQAGHDRLWLCSGISVPSAVAGDVAWMLADEPVRGVRPSEVTEHAIALVGLTWPRLLDRHTAVAQMVAYDRVPDWLTRVPVERIWSCRRVVFGDDLVRVPRALSVLRDAYVDEGPVMMP